jgi:putative SOS response-associated peptidase YedK
MCGRYTLSAGDGRRIAERFELPSPQTLAPAVLRRFNVCPSERVLAVDTQRRPLALQWGIGVPGGGSRAAINARAESAGSRPLFAPLIAGAQGRCLVPADGWYEWMRAESRRMRPAPFHHTVDGGELFAFAGLKTRDSVVVLTTRPNAVCARVHDRMPCVLAGPEEEAAWLDPALEPSAITELLRPIAAERVSVAAASPGVNRAGREGPELLEADPTLF